MFIRVTVSPHSFLLTLTVRSTHRHWEEEAGVFAVALLFPVINCSLLWTSYQSYQRLHLYLLLTQRGPPGSGAPCQHTVYRADSLAEQTTVPPTAQLKHGGVPSHADWRLPERVVVRSAACSDSPSMSRAGTTSGHTIPECQELKDQTAALTCSNLNLHSCLTFPPKHQFLDSGLSGRLLVSVYFKENRFTESCRQIIHSAQRLVNLVPVEAVQSSCANASAPGVCEAWKLFKI